MGTKNCLASTHRVLGNSLERCESRSLWFDRFGNPSAKESERQDYFINGSNKMPFSGFVRYRSAFIKMMGTVGQGFDARLESRLMINMAGGVMENANLCIDRFSGIPFVPGSAVKGCARRMALQTLWDAVETAPEREAEHGEALADVTMIFGWGDSDWTLAKDKSGYYASDFAWAVHGFSGIFAKAANELAKRLSVSISERFGTQPWKCLPSYGGDVSFHSAWPTSAPNGSRVGALELDVLTSHHPDYYSDYYSDKTKVALDCENPNPVFFPAVKAGQVFSFAVTALRGTSNDRVSQAARLLKEGLQLFGIGAKTNAGYGWFTILDGRSASVDSEPGVASAVPVPSGDYSDKTFDNLVITRLNKPQEYNLLQGDKGEVAKLKKPENSEWLEKLKSHLASPAGKDARKRLKGKTWFPQEWLG